MSLKKVLIFSDVHAPYHDKRAWNLMLKVAKAWKPDTIVSLGDFADCYAVSSHSRNPKMAMEFGNEIKVCRSMLLQLDALGAQKKIFLAGNHEDRLQRYVQDKCPELFDVISIPGILKLAESNWEYVPYRQFHRLGKLFMTHDVGGSGRFAHYKVGEVFQRNVVSGHTHRIGVAVEGNIEGKRHIAASFGWLGDVNAIDYMSKAKVIKDWSLGFGVAYMDETTGFIYLQAIPVVDYTVVFEGKKFTA
jgi:predicted phosphodiesterase